jgi:hypothetical protein
MKRCKKARVFLMMTLLEWGHPEPVSGSGWKGMNRLSRGKSRCLRKKALQVFRDFQKIREFWGVLKPRGLCNGNSGIYELDGDPGVYCFK